MEEHLKIIAQTQLGSAIGFHKVEAGQQEFHCPHPVDGYGIVFEHGRIGLIKDKHGDLVGYAGRCGCGVMYFYLPE